MRRSVLRNTLRSVKYATEAGAAKDPSVHLGSEFELPRSQPLVQASKHPRGGIHAGEIYPGLKQWDGNPSVSAHQLQDLALHLGSFLYVEADVEIGGDVEVVDIGHAIVVDGGIVRSGFAPVLAS